MTYRARWTLLVGLAVFIAVLGTFAAHAAVTELSVGSYQLLGSTRVTRTVFEYTYKANVTNASAVAMRDVAATLRSTAAQTVVVQGLLHFGEVPAGRTVPSSDTFTIRQDRSLPFNPAALVWQVTGTPVPPSAILVPDVVGLPQ